MENKTCVPKNSCGGARIQRLTAPSRIIFFSFSSAFIRSFGVMITTSSSFGGGFKRSAICSLYTCVDKYNNNNCGALWAQSYVFITCKIGPHLKVASVHLKVFRIFMPFDEIKQRFADTWNDSLVLVVSHHTVRLA